MIRRHLNDIIIGKDGSSLSYILELHKKFIDNEIGGIRANLENKDLSSVDMRGMNLSNANLMGADLTCTNMATSNLTNANLSRANLVNTNLSGANLGGAILSRANLTGTNLAGTNLTNAILPHFQICPQEGSFIAYKAVHRKILTLEIPADAKRTSTLTGRKCRAEFVRVLSGSGRSFHDENFKYVEGEIVRPDSYNDDIRIECTHGIHFFMTREEAKMWL